MLNKLTWNSCYKQGVEPFKITFRFRFRCGKFYFFGFSLSSGSAIFLRGLVPVQLRFGFGTYLFCLFLTSVRTLNTISYLMLSWASADALPGGVMANSCKPKKEF